MGFEDLRSGRPLTVVLDGGDGGRRGCWFLFLCFDTEESGRMRIWRERERNEEENEGMF